MARQFDGRMAKQHHIHLPGLQLTAKDMRQFSLKLQVIGRSVMQHSQVNVAHRSGIATYLRAK
jgi:thiamine monophosphate synthase